VAIVIWFVMLSSGAGAIALISVKDEIAIGAQTQQQVRRQVPELRDVAVRSYITDVGRQLARQARGAAYPYSFSVADYREINAFALPGGPVWIHRGAIARARNEAELASVLAHEVAHISERHAADQLTKAMGANLALGLLGALLGDGSGAQAAQIAAQFVATGAFLKFSRDDEREADRVGADIMHRAGWDARGMIDFMMLLRSEQGRDPGSVEEFFSSHPSPEGRIELLQQTVSRLKGGRRDSARFQEIKRRLASLPPARSSRR
jgi:beta-barrel assembly-enhancing protease